MSKWWLLLALAIGGTACSGDSLSPRSLDQPVLLITADGVPALANPVVKFWAYSDRESRAQVVYHAVLGSSDSVTLVDFTVPAHSLSKLPDGSTIGASDSVLISISVTNPLLLDARFEPSGLQFSESNPAKLRMGFGNADPDYNQDGVVDAADTALVPQLHIWRQEGLLDPWVELPGTVDLQRLEVAADISGFTHYAVAF